MKLKFYIRYAWAETQVYPIYGEGFAVKYSEVENEVYKRKEIQGDLTFKGLDFDYIMLREETQVFTLRVVDENAHQEEIHFTRRQGITDIDEHAFTVTPSINDEYASIEAILDKEINWLISAPEKQTLLIKVTPIIQIYELGSDRITCYGIGGNWTQTVQNLVNQPHHLKTNHGFGDAREFWYARTRSWQMDNLVFDPQTRESLDGKFYITEAYTANPTYNPDEWWDDPNEYRWEIRLKANDQVIWAEPWWNHPSIFREPYDTVYDVIAEGYEKIELRRRRFAMRMVGANNTYGDWKVIQADDIMPASIYKFAYPLGTGELHVEQAYEDEENRYYGIRPDFAFFPRTPYMHKAPNNEYVAPTHIQQNVIPIDPESWDGVSFWLIPSISTNMMIALDMFTSDHILRDTYTLGGMIQSVFTQTGIGIVFNEATDSEFFSSLPVLVTPKGNVVVWNYTAPTTESIITLGQILEILKKTFRVFWHLEDGHLKLEHLSYYHNGGSYENAIEVALDLTTNTEVQGIKRLSYFQNKFQFDNKDIPWEITHEFEDNCSRIFNGFGIRHRSMTAPLDTNIAEQIKIERIATDLQHALVNPERYTKEGLFLFEYTEEGNQNRVPLTTFNLREQTHSDNELTNVETALYSILNGRLSMAYLLDRYHDKDRETNDFEINTITRKSNFAISGATQQIEFPYTLNVEWLKGFRTDLGTGLIREITVNFMTKHTIATISPPYKHYSQQEEDADE